MTNRHAGVAAAFTLADHCIYLAQDGTMRCYAKTAEFFGRANSDAELADGHVLALHRAKTPQDVHYPIWEMHPEGDELLVLAAGSITVEFRDAAIGPTAAIGPSSAIVIPAGAWHRIVVREPSTLIAITRRRNTPHAQP